MWPTSVPPLVLLCISLELPLKSDPQVLPGIPSTRVNPQHKAWEAVHLQALAWNHWLGWPRIAERGLRVPRQCLTDPHSPTKESKKIYLNNFKVLKYCQIKENRFLIYNLIITLLISLFLSQETNFIYKGYVLLLWVRSSALIHIFMTQKNLLNLEISIVFINILAVVKFWPEQNSN